MAAETPFIVALCPTYRRPRLLANAIACFEAQDFPVERRQLLICDDSGEHHHQWGKDWCLLDDTPDGKPFATLPGKYTYMAEMAIYQFPKVEAFCVWEDDDVMLPWHLAAHAAALSQPGALWSHPSYVWTDGSGGGPARPLAPEPTGHARLHGGLCISREVFERLGGWVPTPRMDFDLQLLARLRGIGGHSDPCRFYPPSYVFRWASTRAYHGQAYCTGPDDEHWLEKCRAAIEARQGPVQRVGRIEPKMDVESASIYNQASWLRLQWAQGRTSTI